MTRKRFGICSLIVVGLVLVAILVVFLFLRTRSGVQTFAKAVLGSESAQTDTVSALVPTILGYDRPRTVLFLFLNNTELRPGGGFIGSYGITTFDRGVPQQLATDGTENLDYNAPATFKVEPPQPIKDHLIGRWFFRDSNWSPDFAVSSRRALQFYAAEGGDRADQIETVIGITPEVLETVLRYTGPITIDGKTYTSETITDALEYEVEIEYTNKGTPKSERKAVISHLSQEIAARMVHVSPIQWLALMQDMLKLANQGHVILYDVNAPVQSTIENLGWGGSLHAGTSDKLMVVDANLASLKTDRVMKRAVKYAIFKDTASGEWRAQISNTYTNNGGFDWRTSRYNTYTRWYLPEGTRFVSGEGSQKDFKHPTEPAPWDVTIEEGRTVVGSFFVIEPGQTKTVSITVALAPSVVAAIQSGTYGLYVQKQLGVDEIKLTIHGDFGTSVKTATPPEPLVNFGDQFYDWSENITQDSEFTVKL